MAQPNLEPASAWPPLPGLRIDTVCTSVETPNSTYGPFQLPLWGVTWIIEGGGFSTLDEERVATQPGTFLIERPGMVLSHDWGERRSLQSFVVFQVDEVPAPWPAPEAWLTHRQLDPDDVVLSVFRHLVSLGIPRPETLPVALPELELVLRLLLSGQHGPPNTENTVLPEPVEAALAFAVDHLRNRTDQLIHLPQLAHAAHVTPGHLCRLFQQSLGLSPMEGVRAIRLELAATLLDRSEIDLATIADRFGFSSQFHFSRAFKQAYGVAPSEYRRAVRQGLTIRPAGLAFRHHRIRQYAYEISPGRLR